MKHDLFGDEPLRALTWKDPYGTLMLKGKIETRTWPTNYRGLVLICVAKQGYKLDQLMNISGKHQTERALHEYCQNRYINIYPGHAIAVGCLADCRPMSRADEDKCYVEYHFGLWCHVYENVQPIEPLPWKGKQGWSNVPTEVREKIKFL